MFTEKKFELIKELSSMGPVPQSVGQSVASVESVSRSVESVESVAQSVEAADHSVEAADHSVEAVDHSVEAVESVPQSVESVPQSVAVDHSVQSVSQSEESVPQSVDHLVDLSKHKELPELDFAVDFPGLFVIGMQTLRTMKLWHQAVKELNNIERAVKWISEIDFSLDISPVFRAEPDAELASKLEAIPIFSERDVTEWFPMLRMLESN
ncbi:hypothetical protein PInf_008706 [Phytophthora infestans]|nr:hypothetical protein PInf_008706 [Phytophthora infestans]